MYFQVEREQTWCWSQSYGSLHNHPGRLLFHLNVFLYLSLCICIYTLFYSVAKATHILLLASSSASSLTAVRFLNLLSFMSKYIFRWKATQLSVHMVFKPDPYIDGERLFWFNQLIRSRPGPLPALLPPELYFLIPNTKYYVDIGR